MLLFAGWSKDRDSPLVETVANSDIMADEHTALVTATAAVDNPEYFQANKATPLLIDLEQ